MGEIPSEFWWFVVIGTGIIVGFLVAFISSLVFSNRILKEEKDFTFSIMKTTTALMLVIDDEGIVRRFNQALEILTGYTSKEIEGKKLVDSKLYEKNESLFQLLAKPENSENTIETVLQRKNGNQRIVEWTYNFFEGISEKKSWKIWTGADITELVKTQKVLEEINKTLEIRVEKQTEELSSLIEQSPFAIIVFNPDGKFVRTNTIFEGIVSSEDLTEKLSSYNYLHNPFILDDEAIFDSKNIFLYGGKFVSQKLNVKKELKFFNFSSKIQWVVLRFYAVQDKSKKVFRVACLIEDVTEQKMVEEAYNQLKEQKIKSATILNTLEQERQRISQELHDGVQQILTGAKIKLETFEMSTGIENKFITESSELLVKTSDEIRRIIKDLHPQEIDRFGLFPALENLSQDIKNIKNIDVFFENTFNGEVDKIYHLPVYRIIQEGFGNIVKHSGCSKCSLVVSGNEKLLNVELTDNGKGFGKDNPKAGHGLSNMKKRAEFIGGNLDIDSEVNKGTKLLLTIPLEKYG
ncbi:MAG: PAS domain S-box protein [Rhodothermaceae bacterium]